MWVTYYTHSIDCTLYILLAYYSACEILGLDFNQSKEVNLQSWFMSFYSNDLHNIKAHGTLCELTKELHDLTVSTWLLSAQT